MTSQFQVAEAMWRAQYGAKKLPAHFENSRFFAYAAAALAAINAIREADARTVLPVTLEAALAEPYVCADCDQQQCICWAYDETLEAPVDVHPAYRYETALRIQAHRRRELAKVAAARAMHMAVAS